MIRKAPVKFKPYLKTVIWGGNKICGYKEIDQPEPNIGESWEISAVPGHESVVIEGDYTGRTITDLISEFGEELIGSRVFEKYSRQFPLLIKFIDAADNLSVQVHPDDKLAKERHDSLGKTEMWYIIQSDRNARIYAGLKLKMTPEDYQKRVDDNTIMEAVAEHESNPGDVFFLPAGRVHAIGAGNLLAEIQESSDITYRIYDYNRKDKNGDTRELHTVLAKDAIDYNLYDDLKHPVAEDEGEDRNLVSCPHFTVNKIKSEGKKTLTPAAGSFTILMCIEGGGMLACDDGEASIKKGSTLLIPASCEKINIDGSGVFLQVSC